MKVKLLRKRLAVIMTFMILFWSALPSVSMAFFITPGKAIQYGEPIKGGAPITGGQFIIPGKVYEIGSPIEKGSPINGVSPIISGQPLIPSYQGSNGQYIIPNIIGTPRYGNWLITGSYMTNGDAVTGGSSVEGGNVSVDGSPVQSGTAVEGGEASLNGDATSSGDALNGGDGLSGGQAGSSGDVVKGGKAGSDGQIPVPSDTSGGGDSISGGEAPSGGDLGNDGQEPPPGDFGSNGENLTGGNSNSDGKSLTGGTADSNGEVPSGGDAGENGTGTSGESGAGDGTSIGAIHSNSPSTLNILFSSTDTSRGPLGIIVGGIKDAKRYITGFGKTFMEGFSSYYAGFDFKELKSGNYKVVGNSKLKNPVLDYFYNNYKKYKVGSRDAYMPAGKTNPKPHKVNSFFESKKFTNFDSPKTFFSSTWKSVKSGLNEGFNPFTKKFWAGSNMLKLNGPVNIATSAFNSLYDYSPAGSKASLGYGSNFAADLTVDIAIGAGTTVLSSVASSIAAGAVAGSVVPGLGTVVGAAAGLLVGLTTTYLINGTSWGRKGKEWVSGKLSEGYNWVADKAKGLFSSAKSFFGFGN